LNDFVLQRWLAAATPQSSQFAGLGAREVSEPWRESGWLSPRASRIL
jgi:hypothetical protein